ncbi:MAG: DUF433 domain-containing protein [Flavobacteriales bacterium]|nr:MAG: DUF433 domain-containing protein [Flavobacteriales bacterium]
MSAKQTHIGLRDTPAYTMAQAAHYLGLPYSTVKSWVVGQTYYDSKEQEKFLKPLIHPADKDENVLSFRNLVELHVLSVTRREYKIPMPQVRIAIEYIKKEIGTAHPLSDVDLQTDGVDLLVEQLGQLVAANKGGQVTMRDVVLQYLKRIERDKHGVPLRLYPFTRKAAFDQQPRLVVIDPELSFGRLALADIGVSTRMIANRIKAGESIEDLMADYNCSSEMIVEALRCEMTISDAA